jgi:hypothetical protein
MIIIRIIQRGKFYRNLILKPWKPIGKNPEIVLLLMKFMNTSLSRRNIFHTRKKLLNRSVMVSSFGKSFHVTDGSGLFSSARIFDERNQSTSVLVFSVVFVRLPLVSI